MHSSQLLRFNSPPVTRLLPLPTPRGPVTVSASSRTVTLAQPAPPIEKRGPAKSPPADSPSAAFWDYQFLFLSQRAEAITPVPLPAVAGSVPADFPRGTYYLTGPGLFSDDHGSTVHPLDGHGYLRSFEFDDDKTVKYSARYVKTEAEAEEREGNGEWRFTHRGPFSVLKGGRKMGNVKVMKNVANTSVVKWGGRVMCLWEGGDPYEVEEGSLGTEGAVDLVGGGGEDEGRGGRARGGVAERLKEVGVDLAAGVLKPILHELIYNPQSTSGREALDSFSSLHIGFDGVFRMPPKRLLSHYKIDPKRNRLLLLSCNAEDMLLPRSNFTFYEFDSNFNLIQKKDFIIHDHLMIHDWAVTDDHYIIIGNRIKLDIPGSMLAVSGLSPMISALSVNPSQPTTPIYLLPRSSQAAERDWRVPVEAPAQLWVSHVGNAFEERDSVGNVEMKLHASVCSYRWFNFQKMFGYNWKTGKLDPAVMNVQSKEASLVHLVEVSIKLDAKGECGQCSIKRPSEQWKRSADFPVINLAYSGRRNAYIYAGTSSGSRRFLPHFPFDTVLKINCDDGSAASWWAGKRAFIGEPIFVAREGAEEEEDGYIVVVEYAVSKQKCYLVILDAKLIGRPNALVAKLEVPKHLSFPFGFHGFWASK